MSTTHIPVPVSERADILDVIRGFAVCGIFVNNILVFSGYAFISLEDKKLFSSFPLDRVLFLLQVTFVQGKFYSLFSLLFGIGFSILLIRNEQKGIHSLRIFYRRLGILLVIGVLHCRFLWDGDILVLYAIIGFLLPLFRRLGDRALIITALALLLSPIVIDIIRILVQWSPGDFLTVIAQEIDKRNGIPLDSKFAYHIFKEGSGWREWASWNESGWLYRYEFILNSNRIPKVLGMFLIGFYVGRKQLFQNLASHELLFRKIRFWGFVVGIPASIAMAFFEIDGQRVPSNVLGLLDTFSYAISVVPLGMAYAASICLLWIKTKKSRLRVLGPVGKMALTNYLMQTAIGIIVFYGVGFGLGAKFGPTYVFPMAIGILILQILVSNFWFRYFQYGPMEWIWRQLTYGKKLSLFK